MRLDVNILQLRLSLIVVSRFRDVIPSAVPVLKVRTNNLALTVLVLETDQKLFVLVSLDKVPLHDEVVLGLMGNMVTESRETR